jgi:isocitrate dehydrogenase
MSYVRKVGYILLKFDITGPKITCIMIDIIQAYIHTAERRKKDIEFECISVQPTSIQPCISRNGVLHFNL